MSKSTVPPPTPPPAAPRQNDNRHQNQHQHNRPLSQFVPKIPGIKTLGTSSEQRGHNFTKFLKSIHHHALTTFHNSKDISTAIVEFKDPLAALKQATLSLSEIRRQNNLNPSLPVADEDAAATFIREADNADRRDEAMSLYGIQLKSNAEREKDLTQYLTILLATIMGQCTPALQEEVHGEPEYLSKSSTFDSVWLLQSLQKITAGVNNTTNKYHSVFKATKKFYSTQQSNTESIDEFYNRFENAKDLYLAIAIFMNANKVKYEPLWNKLENDFLAGQDSYPKTIGNVIHLLTNWKASAVPSTHPTSNPNDQDRRNPDGTPAVSFATIEWATLVPLPTNDDFSALAGFDSTCPTFAPSRKPPHDISPDIECIKCKKKRHYATACPFIVLPQLFQFARLSVQLNQTQAQSILVPGSIIVDSGFTFNCFHERNLISNMHSINSVTAYPFSLFNTVIENKQFFSRREIEGAEVAHAQQEGQIGWSSDQEYLIMKSTKIKFYATKAFNRSISKHKKNILRTTYKRGPKDIINGIEKVLNVFRNRGFQVNLINADNEFKKLENKVSAHVEICAAGQEHIPQIQHSIRFMKDRTRCF